MSELQNLAEELSFLSDLNFSREEDTFIFEVDKLTSLILETHKEKIFFSLCHKVRQERKIKQIIIKLLKLLYPAKTQQMFYKVFLLESYIVISVRGSSKELPPKTLYQFQNHAFQCLIRAKKGE